MKSSPNIFRFSTARNVLQLLQPLFYFRYIIGVYVSVSASRFSNFVNDPTLSHPLPYEFVTRPQLASRWARCCRRSMLIFLLFFCENATTHFRRDLTLFVAIFYFCLWDTFFDVFFAFVSAFNWEMIKIISQMMQYGDIQRIWICWTFFYKILNFPLESLLNKSNLMWSIRLFSTNLRFALLRINHTISQSRSNTTK